MYTIFIYILNFHLTIMYDFCVYICMYICTRICPFMRLHMSVYFTSMCVYIYPAHTYVCVWYMYILSKFFLCTYLHVSYVISMKLSSHQSRLLSVYTIFILYLIKSFYDEILYRNNNIVLPSVCGLLLVFWVFTNYTLIIKKYTMQLIVATHKLIGKLSFKNTKNTLFQI